AQLLSGAPALPGRLLQPRMIVLRGEAAATIEHVVARVKAECQGTQPWRALAIDAALCTLLVALERAAPRAEAQRAERGSRAAMHLARYRELIDVAYRTQP